MEQQLAANPDIRYFTLKEWLMANLQQWLTIHNPAMLDKHWESYYSQILNQIYDMPDIESTIDLNHNC